MICNNIYIFFPTFFVQYPGQLNKRDGYLLEIKGSGVGRPTVKEIEEGITKDRRKNNYYCYNTLNQQL